MRCATCDPSTSDASTSDASTSDPSTSDPSTSDPSTSAAWADALFASALQRSEEPSATEVKQAVAAAMDAFGDLGCVARVAQAYGEDPETAVTRMRWACTTVAVALGEPARVLVPGPRRQP